MYAYTQSPSSDDLATIIQSYLVDTLIRDWGKSSSQNPILPVFSECCRSAQATVINTAATLGCAVSQIDGSEVRDRFEIYGIGPLSTALRQAGTDEEAPLSLVVVTGADSGDLALRSGDVPNGTPRGSVITLLRAAHHLSILSPDADEDGLEIRLPRRSAVVLISSNSGTLHPALMDRRQGQALSLRLREHWVRTFLETLTTGEEACL